MHWCQTLSNVIVSNVVGISGPERKCSCCNSWQVCPKEGTRKAILLAESTEIMTGQTSSH